MKRIPFFLMSAALVTSCGTTPLDQVVSQTYVHKYGFETSEQDWEAREKDGQVVTTLKNGVKITRTYENGQLHGPTTYTFPKSNTVEKLLVYDQGTLLRELVNDSSGMPLREETYEFDNRVLITLWDEKGVPLSIEEYQNDTLMEAKYFTPEHEKEAVVENGTGERIKRDRSGLLISRDTMVDGAVIARTTYHPNGTPHTISHYEGYQLHGPQTKFTASGRPLMELSWNHGILDGEKVVYRNGLKAAIIPYAKGKKHGTEIHYDDIGNLTAEIEWREDKKHGETKLHTEDYTDSEWFFHGQSVSLEKFNNLEAREQLFPRSEVR